MVDTNNPKISEDVSALRDAYFWVPVGEPEHTAARIHRILDACEMMQKAFESIEVCPECESCKHVAWAVLQKVHAE